MSPQPSLSKVNALTTIVGKRPPLCSGVTPLEKNGVLYYRKPQGKDAGYLNFASIDEGDLDMLNAACVPVSPDGSYHNLDTDHFSSLLDIHTSGIVQHVTNELLDGKTSLRELRFELDELKIFGKDSYVKSNKVPPNSKNSFGTLVVIFPTSRAGGSLILRREDEEWEVNPISAISQQATPSLFFVAFYKDVEQAVLPLQSGHMVTVTFNIYLKENRPKKDDGDKRIKAPRLPTTPIHRSAPDYFVLKSALSSFIQDPNVFPNGGVLAFGLSFEYPLPKSSSWRTPLSDLIRLFKGTDAIIRDVAHSLCLEVVPEILIRDWEYPLDVMYPEVGDFTRCHVLSWAERLAKKSGSTGFVLHEVGKPDLDLSELEVEVEVKDVIWITPATDLTMWESDFIHGHEDGRMEDSDQEITGELVLAVMVGPPGQRETLSNESVSQWEDGSESDAEVDGDGDEESNSESDEGSQS